MNVIVGGPLGTILFCIAISVTPPKAVLAEVITFDMPPSGFTPVAVGGVAVDNKGNAIVTWTGGTGAHAVNALLAKPILSKLSIVTKPVKIPTVVGNQPGWRANVGMDSSGAWVISWVEYAHDLPVAIIARRYDQTGKPVRAAEVISQLKPDMRDSRQADVAVVRDGRSVVVWNDLADQNSRLAIYARRLDSSGASVGSTIRVSPPIPEAESDSVVGSEEPRVAVDTKGGFVVVWIGRLGTSNPYGIYVQRFMSDGTPLGKWQVANKGSGLPGSPDVAVGTDGRFVVVWDEAINKNIWARPFNADGTPAAEPFAVVVGHRPVVAMGADGLFVVVGTWGFATAGSSQLGGDLFKFPKEPVDSIAITPQSTNETLECRNGSAWDLGSGLARCRWQRKEG